MKKIILSIFIISIFSSCESVLNTLSSNNLISKNYTSATITKVTILEFSRKQANGMPWDPLGGKPDIYFKIGEDGFKRVTKKDVELGTTPNWILQKPFTMNNIYDETTLFFYDEDQEGLNLSNDDFMGKVTFSPQNHKGLSNVILSSTTNPQISIQLDLIWK
jgi:hypothetical protein